MRWFLASGEVLGDAIKQLPNDVRLVKVEDHDTSRRIYKVTVEGDLPEGTDNLRVTVTRNEDGSLTWDWGL